MTVSQTNGVAGELAELRQRNLQLEQALESRIVIEQAKGILAERLGLDVDEAFDVLRAAARRNRLKLRELAADVVSSRETPRAVAEGYAARNGSAR